MRHDFKEDAGQPITLCRISPNCKKLFVGKGTIVGGGDYAKELEMLGECLGLEVVRVSFYYMYNSEICREIQLEDRQKVQKTIRTLCKTTN